jgi:hypothetical protein
MAFVASILLLIIYIIWLALYRLYLSPLAQFPGPKLAALSQWYEVYYDIVFPGQFIFQIQKMHKTYGILMETLFHSGHIISDPDFKVQLFVLRHLNYTSKTAITGTNSTPGILDMTNINWLLRGLVARTCYSLRQNTTCTQFVVRY